MFGKNVKKLKEEIELLTAREKELKDKVAKLERDNKSLTEEVQGYKRQICTEVSNSGFAVNFKLLNASSIERAVIEKNSEYHFDRGVTNIGYLIEGKMHEWIFECSLETHERLVKEFNQYNTENILVKS